MKQQSSWLLVLACGIILAVEAPLVISSLAADLEGAYPAWESAEAVELESLEPEPLGFGRELELLEELSSGELPTPEFNAPLEPAFRFEADPVLQLSSSLGR